ncbi:MAG: twin-arginine translocase TatA/TatE family subunit [Thermodesulfobacteriota bacterium]
MFGLGMPELLVILGIAFLIFGAKRLPDIGKSLGSAIRNFRKSVSGKEEPQEIETKEEKKKEA